MEIFKKNSHLLTRQQKLLIFVLKVFVRYVNINLRIRDTISFIKKNMWRSND